MAALRLRTEARDWWLALPWVDANRTRRGFSRPGDLQRSLIEMSERQAEASGQPQLVQLFRRPEVVGTISFDDLERDPQLPNVELPQQFTQDDLGRLWVAAAALAHGGFGFVGATHEHSERCVVCGRQFYPGALDVVSREVGDVRRVARE